MTLHTPGEAAHAVACPYCEHTGEKKPVPFPGRSFLFCLDCGLVFEVLGDAKHQDLAASVYSSTSWGQNRQLSIANHGPRLNWTLRELHKSEPLNKTLSYLDIGAGVGVLEHFLFEVIGNTQLDVVALEPVREIAERLQEQYPQIKVWNKDLEHLHDDDFKSRFDVIFCLGVDYLFRDLEKSLQILKQLSKGRVAFSRNVFLDMPCYFGGKKIRAFQDLVGPNPLISQFMYSDQYMEVLSRHFTLKSAIWAVERFSDGQNPDFTDGRTLLVECVPSASARQPVVKNPDRARARLRELGVPVD